MARSFNANSDRDAGSRDTVYRKPAAAAKSVAAPAKSKGPANAGPVKTAGAPAAKKNITGQGRPAVVASNSYSPKNDKQYNTYSSSGATQSAAKRPATSTGNGRPSVPASNGRPDTIFNSNSAFPGEKAMNDFGKKIFGSSLPGEEWLNKKGRGPGSPKAVK
jgi:hypothetical protein